MKRIAFSLLILLAGQSHAAAFQNGSFELGSFSGTPAFDTIGAGSSAITGWQVLGHSVDWINQSFWQSSNGRLSIDLNGAGFGGLAQTFDTIAGQRYTVNFDLAGNTDRQSVKSVAVNAGDFSQTFQFNSVGHSFGNMGWSKQSFSFTAQANQTTLSFVSPTNDGNTYWGAALDNVSVQVAPVPEPETYALMGLGLLGLIASRRRRIQN